MASTVRVLDLLHTPIRVRGGNRRIERSDVRGELRLDHVTFGYGDRGAPVLRDVSVHVPAGHDIAIVGPTGSGKSTIVKLLLRFYEPRDGAIYLDGTDLRHIELTSLRRAIGLVSQDVFLFHGTVRDNIHYGTFDASHDEVVAAAQAAEADAFIRDLPQGYDTIVGERGQKLSGGQRQRISIARAVLKDPAILILDEATSAVDNETEAAIQRSMVRVAAGRTTIMIAHRLSTIRHADRILVLSKGEVEVAGTHDELLGADGTYADLWRVQTGERPRAPREATT
jgi:ATP-binding cassette subfamily B protein